MGRTRFSRRLFVKKVIQEGAQNRGKLFVRMADDFIARKLERVAGRDEVKPLVERFMSTGLAART